MILLIDNYDSFTYNLYQYVGIFAEDVQVVRNDRITCDEIEKLAPEKIILSPGPKNPDEAGICPEVVRRFYQTIPMMGICLGHQCIGQALGGRIVYAKEIFHGKQSLISHDGNSVFSGIDSPIKIARYHSLAVERESLPDCLQILAQTEDGEIMAMRHREYPVVGLQFHPESVFTQHGKRIVENFVNGVI